ncbi:MAG: fibronectin type III domain-containing protein, partial [Clostridia bacterium]|nr:fibronectin type III domain-containing protein [Clostridia bacterium]
PTKKNIRIPFEPAPVTITGLTYENGEVTINWDEVPNMDGYRVYRNVSGGKWGRLVNLTTDTTFTDSNVESGTTYYYVVRSKSVSLLNDGWTETVRSITIE